MQKLHHKGMGPPLSGNSAGSPLSDPRIAGPGPFNSGNMNPATAIKPVGGMSPLPRSPGLTRRNRTEATSLANLVLDQKVLRVRDHSLDHRTLDNPNSRGPRLSNLSNLNSNDNPRISLHLAKGYSLIQLLLLQTHHPDGRRNHPRSDRLATVGNGRLGGRLGGSSVGHGLRSVIPQARSG